MTTVGTLYDESIKFGFGKHIQTYTVPSATSSLGFLLPAEYDTFLFEFLNIFMSVADQILCMRVSMDNGATWKTSALHYFTYLYMTSHGSPLGTAYQYNNVAHFYISGWQYIGSGFSGELFYHRGAGFVPPFSWHMAGQHATAGTWITRGGGTYWEGGLINALLFFPTSGNITQGRVNIYGLRKGA
jgi:hypothetical protein